MRAILFAIVLVACEDPKSAFVITIRECVDACAMGGGRMGSFDPGGLGYESHCVCVAGEDGGR